jgi:hypothetical protein
MTMGLCICQKHKEAKDAIRMPRMVDWISEWMISNPDDWFRTHAKRISEFYKTTPKISDYVAVDESGSPMKDISHWKTYEGSANHYKKFLYNEAKKKTLFEGWESYSVATDEANGINRIKMIGTSSNFVEILFFDSGLVRLCAKTKVFENPNYEDAFIAFPHYLTIKS